MLLNVAAVVVTYNRCQSLLTCVRGLLDQTAALSTIVIIDNASIDGTESVLRQAGILDHPVVRYIRVRENIGGAGGFNVGLRAALETDADWFWMLDDDVTPRDSCLELLMSYSAISECIHPLVVYGDGSCHEWEHIFEPSTTYQVGLGNVSFKNGKTWCPMHVGCFEGMLVKRRIVDKIGLPLIEFFVFGDDGHYGFLASQHTNVIYVSDAVMEKAQKPLADNTPFRIYYDLRNRFLLRRIVKNHRESKRFDKYMFYVFMVFHTRELISPPNRLSKIKAAFRGWFDGLKGVTGRRRY